MSNMNYQTAQDLLAEGEGIVARIRDAHTSATHRDDLGKKAMGIWAQAHVYATLALVDATADLAARLEGSEVSK